MIRQLFWCIKVYCNLYQLQFFNNFSAQVSTSSNLGVITAIQKMYLRWQYRIAYSRLRSLLNKCFHSSYFSLRTVSAKISILTSSSPKQVHLACSQGGLAWNPKTISVNKERTWLLASMPHGWPSMPPVLIILLESTVTSPSWLVKVSRSRWWNMFATKFSNGIKKRKKTQNP